MGKLDGKVAIVTGSSRGIGKAIAQIFATEGAKVVCAARTVNEGEHKFLEGSINTTVSEIKAAGGTALAVQADVSNEEGCDNLVAKTKEVFGPTDILVNNAAYTIFLPIKDCPVKKWFRSFDVNLHAPFMLSQKVLQDMVECRSGAILNITSTRVRGPGRGPYAESPPEVYNNIYGIQKAALERFTQGLAQEVYHYGISVTALSPEKFVNTPGTKYLGISKGPDDPRGEPMETMAKAALLLVTLPVEKISGRVTYSEAILMENGLITAGSGPGIDQPGSGFSEI